MDSNSTWSSAGRGVIRGSFDLAPVQHFSSPKASNHHFLPPPAGCTTGRITTTTILFMDLVAPEDILRPSNLTGHNTVSSGLAVDSLSHFLQDRDPT